MKSIVSVVCICIIALTACSRRTSDAVKMSQEPGGEKGVARETTPAISKEAALEIARRDAKKESVDLGVYEVVALEEVSAWRVVFRLNRKGLNGGGPKYLIDKATGAIVERKYTQ
jgi:Zn-dependent metalloprotease